MEHSHYAGRVLRRTRRDMIRAGAGVALATLAAGGNPGWGEPAFPAPQREELDAALADALTECGAPGVVAGLWIAGEGEWVRTRGVSDKQAKTPMRTDLHFRIGSITKTFTVTVLLQLAQQKRLSLDDPVGNTLPFVRNGEQITFQMLANMTSGIASYTTDQAWQKQLFSNPKRVWTPRQLVDVGLKLPPTFAPGKGWQYSNTNTVLLGMAIEKVAGQPLGTLMRDRIFRPLRLRGTVFPDSAALPRPFAHGYSEQTLDGKPADVTGLDPTWAWGVGNMVSTLADLRVYARALATGEGLLSPEMQRQRLTWVTLPPMTPEHKYGLGIGFDHGWLGHTGELPGYNVVMLYLPDRQATAVVMVNSDIPEKGKDPAPLIARALLTVLTPENVPVG